jgi:FAD:protein FMN transferase
VIALSWQALGTSAVLAVSEDRCLDAARATAEQEIDRIDRACSRFRPDSGLSRLNAAAGSWVQVDELLMEAVELALRAARATDGDVDPTIGHALEQAGYDRDFSLLSQIAPGSPASPASPALHALPASVPSPALPGSSPSSTSPSFPASAASLPGSSPSSTSPSFPASAISLPESVLVRIRPRAGWQTVQLDRRRGAIRLAHGIKLDLGATAKAWAADRACRAVHAQTGCGTLVSLGGDISTCGAAPAEGWRVHVTDDHRAGPQAPGQRVTILGGGLATSSVAVRRWAHRGREMHHIIDPASGEPARGPWRTVSVAAIDCADANIASTAALVRGERALEWLAGLGVPARLVDHAGHVCTIGGWPAERAAA